MRPPQSYFLMGAIVLAITWAGSFAGLRTLRSSHVNVGPAISISLAELGMFSLPPETLRPEVHIQVLESGKLAKPVNQTANLLYWPLLKLEEKGTGTPVSFGGYPVP